MFSNETLFLGMDLFQLFFGVRAGLNFRSILVLILGCILPYVFQKTSYTKIKIVEYSSFEFTSLPASLPFLVNSEFRSIRCRCCNFIASCIPRWHLGQLQQPTTLMAVRKTMNSNGFNSCLWECQLSCITIRIFGRLVGVSKLFKALKRDLKHSFVGSCYNYCVI